MKANVSLQAQSRDKAGKGTARGLRREGLVPGIIYGKKQEPVMIALPQKGKPLPFDMTGHDDEKPV